jgi:hypothetical protein
MSLGGMSMAADKPRRGRDEPVNELVESFTREQLAELLVYAAEQHADVA